MSTALDRFADAEPDWETPVLIESQLNGVRTKSMNPNTPCSYEEIIEDAIRCWDAGATTIHAHNSDFDLRGKDAYEDYMKAWETILDERPDMIWYPTTCNSDLLDEDECGLEHVPYLNEEANVQIIAVDSGIDQFVIDEDEEGYLLGRPYGFDLEEIADQVAMCRERDIASVWGVYQPGHLRIARHYTDRGMFSPGTHWDFYLAGEYGLTSEKPIGTAAMEPTLESLYYCLDMIEDAEYDLPWYISIWGEGDVDPKPVMRRAIELGGHIKTGLEPRYSPDHNPTNLELLEEAQEIAQEVGRPLATQDEAREMCGMS
jgi:3-keto-5-aminohexanoate cleavage enzyme